MKLTERQEKILEIIKKNSPIPGEKIAERLGVTRSALRTDFSILKKTNLINSKTKKGYYYNFKCTQKKVSEVMSGKHSIDLNMSVYDAILSLFNYDLGTLIVTDKECLVGIISRKDLLKSTLAGNNLEKIPVSMIMTRMPNIVYCLEDETILGATRKLIEHEIDSLPIIKKENDKLVVVGRFTKTNTTKLYFQEISKL